MCALILQKEKVLCQAENEFPSFTKTTKVYAKNDWYGKSAHATLGNVAFEQKTKIQIFSNSFALYNPNRCVTGNFTPERAKNDIGKFSKHSRLRMMKVLSKLNLNSYAGVFHVTLTYRNEFPKSLTEVKYQFKKFTQLLKYRNLEFSFVSRIEFQKRGAPHLHVIFLFKQFPKFRNIESARIYFTEYWLRSIESDSLAQLLHAVKVTSTKEPKQFFYYVSKYSAKEDEVNSYGFKGRRWSCSSNLDISPLEEYDISNSNSLVLCAKLKGYLKKKNRLSLELEQAITRAPHFHLLISNEEFFEVLAFKNTDSP